MRLGNLLVAARLVSPEQIDAALERQSKKGGRLGENLVALGAIDKAKLDAFLTRLPAEPASLQEIGIPEGDLLELLMKVVYTGRPNTVDDFADAIKLPTHLVVELARTLVERHLLIARGAQGQSYDSAMRFTLSEEGSQFAAKALKKSQYTGPAPVTLEAFAARVEQQKITNEIVTASRMREAFKDIVISEVFIERLGPALNSGRAILLYGPPGNGKTSVALRLQKVFSDVIYVPYAVMVEGQIMRIFDPSLHSLPEIPGAAALGEKSILRREQHDARWVACRRPFIITGGELTLEMLDLSYNPSANFYEAPLHVKALGGCFIIDDFGRQLVSPTNLLNRWIVPLEGRVDYLKLQTGKSFSIPFEEMVIFSTNIEPEDLMDAAFLRRIPYKLKVGEPSGDEFRLILQAVTESAKLELSEDLCGRIVQGITEKKGMKLAAYHPKFIVDQVLAACRFGEQPPHFEPRFVDYALDNIKVVRSDSIPGPGAGTHVKVERP
jgi:hypothetical protein